MSVTIKLFRSWRTTDQTATKAALVAFLFYSSSSARLLLRITLI
jgi:hypothetical protein